MVDDFQCVLDYDIDVCVLLLLVFVMFDSNNWVLDSIHWVLDSNMDLCVCWVCCFWLCLAVITGCLIVITGCSIVI